MRYVKVLAAALMMLWGQGVHASFPDTQPTDKNKNELFSYDRSRLPGGKHYIYKDELTVFSNAPDGYKLAGRGGYVCKSSTDSKNGKCPDKLTWIGRPGPNTLITLRFTEEKSKSIRDINIWGYKKLVFPSFAICGPVSGDAFALNDGALLGCADTDIGSSGAMLTLWIDNDELSKLPFGGVWTATLVLDYYQWDPRQYKSTYTVNFKIDLTDKNNIQVWLPQFGKGTPLVDLNLRPVPGGGFKGKNTVDMCLYDGYGTNSRLFTMNFSSTNKDSSDPDAFILKDGNKTLSYNVDLSFQGGSSSSRVRNGADWSINTHSLPVNWNRILPVSLPDISTPVLCWPTKLHLSANVPSTTPAGNYSGTLKIVFTPDAGVP